MKDKLIILGFILVLPFAVDKYVDMTFPAAHGYAQSDADALDDLTGRLTQKPRHKAMSGAEQRQALTALWGDAQ